MPTTYDRENSLNKDIELAFNRDGVLLYRQNTGLGWVGEVVERGPRYLVLQNYRPFHAGLCKGSSDFIGLESVVITFEMVGQTFARFTAVEAKSKRGRSRDEQRTFGEIVTRMGGGFCVAKSLDDVHAMLMRDRRPLL